MKVLSVVCARAGSKGLENKCVKKIGNKMVIEYAIEYSLSLGNGVMTVVSTDIEEVIGYCKMNNVDYIKRDPKYCADDSRIHDALADAIEKKGRSYKYCSLVYGNIPVRYPKLFHEAVRFLENNRTYDAVISMQNVEKYHPAWMFDFNEKTVPRVKEYHYRRQMLPPKMIPDGHTLIFKSKEFYGRVKGTVHYNDKYIYSIFGDKIKPLINDKLIIDIDSGKDLELAVKVLS